MLLRYLWSAPSPHHLNPEGQGSENPMLSALYWHSLPGLLTVKAPPSRNFHNSFKEVLIASGTLDHTCPTSLCYLPLPHVSTSAMILHAPERQVIPSPYTQPEEPEGNPSSRAGSRSSHNLSSLITLSLWTPEPLPVLFNWWGPSRVKC